MRNTPFPLSSSNLSGWILGFRKEVGTGKAVGEVCLAMDIQFGIETEYGISRRDPESIDVVEESIALVRQAAEPGVRMRWDYSREDPHQDARGFRVSELRQDYDEADYYAQDVARKLTFTEIKSDYVLQNGARFYNDHAHPEYCTPECSALKEVLQQDLAGDRLVMNCAAAINEEAENPVVIFKNNTDFQGHSYGCHENYLLPRSLPWDDLAQSIQAFLVTRQIFCGSGKYGWESEDGFQRPDFQISQRSDFFSVLQSVDTMQRRPIVNTRDEPHANPARYRRFHVIIGDANLSPYATWLKVGSTALVLQALVNGAPPEAFPSLQKPIKALKSISRDPQWAWKVALSNGKSSSAVAVQERYIDLVHDYVETRDDEWNRVLQAWTTILEELAADPMTTADRLDWTAKRNLIESFRESEGLKKDDPWLRSLDLAYHQLDHEEGLFFALLGQGAIRSPYTDIEFTGNVPLPPVSTRACLRGGCIGKFRSQIESAQWDFVRIKGRSGLIEVNLSDVFDSETIEQGRVALQNAQAPEDLMALPFVKRVRS